MEMYYDEINFVAFWFGGIIDNVFGWNGILKGVGGRNVPASHEKTLSYMKSNSVNNFIPQLDHFQPGSKLTSTLTFLL